MLIIFLRIPVLAEIRGLPWNKAAQAVLILLGLLILERFLLFGDNKGFQRNSAV